MGEKKKRKKKAQNIQEVRSLGCVRAPATRLWESADIWGSHGALLQAINQC